MRKQVVHTILSSILLGIFSLPIAVPAIHNLLDDHEHTTCTEKNSFHFHDNTKDCSICDYLIGIKTFFAEDVEEQAPAPIQADKIVSSEFSRKQSIDQSISVRGPPCLS